MVIVSACLAGIHCKYSGRHSACAGVVEMMQRGEAIPVCPEQLGGCMTPRPVVEIRGGTGADVLDGKCRVMRKDGEDATEAFVRGAEEVLMIARLCGAQKAILKARSPSCGCGKIYDGTFSGKLIDGNGVTAELLLRHGIRVTSEEELKSEEFQA